MDMAGLNAVMAGYWDEGEASSPWRVRLYVDSRADEPRRAALADIFLGRVGGHPAETYASGITEIYGVETATIEVAHERGRQKIRAGTAISVVARAAFDSEAPVTCGIPGHDQPGEEVVHEALKVDDYPLKFEFHGRCGFAAGFDYRG